MNLPMFTEDQLRSAEDILSACRTQGLRLTTAESCTGGLIAALLTEIPGSSDVFERGFVTYSNEAKSEAIGVAADLIARHGAVSAHVATAMAEGALKHSRADIAVAVTGVAGPGGGTAAKPIGLVYIAVARKGTPPVVQRFNFGDIGRTQIRFSTVSEALAMLTELVR